jgi:hypothetical protein
VGPVEGGDRAHVAPVALEPVLDYAARGHEVGDQPVAVVAGRLVGVEGVETGEQTGPVEGEDLGADAVAVGVVGLEGEVDHFAEAVDRDPGEAGGIIAGLRVGGDDREAGAGPLVGGQDVAQVEAVQVVGTDRDHDVGAELRDGVPLVNQGVGVAGGHGRVAVNVASALVWRQDQQAAAGAVQVPRPAVGQVVVEVVGLVLLDHPDVREAAVGHVRKGDVDQPEHARERHRRLGPRGGERAEAAAGAAGQHDGEDARAEGSGRRHACGLPAAPPANP